MKIFRICFSFDLDLWPSVTENCLRSRVCRVQRPTRHIK